jgi:surface antigen
VSRVRSGAFGSASEKLSDHHTGARAQSKTSARVSTGIIGDEAKPVKASARLRVAKRVSRGAGKAAGGAFRGVGKVGDQIRGQARGEFGLEDGADPAARIGQMVGDVAETAASKGTVRVVKASPKVVRAGGQVIKTVATTGWRGGRAAYRGSRTVVSSASGMFARAKALRAARETRRAAAVSGRTVTTGVRVAQVASRVAAWVAAKAAVVVASAVSAPLLLVVGVAVVVVALVVSLLSWIPGLFDADEASISNVPAEYVGDVVRAGGICPVVTAQVIAAQIEQESGWNPVAVSPAGARGIAQFMPGTWSAHGLDGDGDGVADILNAHDAIWSQGNYMCSLVAVVELALADGRIAGDVLDLTLASYNAGFGNVSAAGGVPSFAETLGYVRSIRTLMEKYSTGALGATVGMLEPPLRMNADGWHVNVEATGADQGSMPSYQRFQCTWWAAIRRNQIGRPVDAHMGNGGWWDDTARRLGYPTGGAVRVGDVLVFEPGVHGSSAVYGHVAVVEEVRADGSVVISQSGTGWMAVVVETISSAQLAAMGSGISFIH